VGRAEGVETDACRRADEAIKRLREAVNYLCEYNIERGYGMKIALEAKPNEPRADIYMATTGQYLGFIPTLHHPEMVGVNPEGAHEHMARLNFMHAVVQAWEMGKLFHIDLNDQMPNRFDQDLRFGSSGPRHFDGHAYRTEDYEGVKDFARGCMRTYLILKEKARRWGADRDIQAILIEIAGNGTDTFKLNHYSKEGASKLLTLVFNKDEILKKRLPYERLDQLTVDLLLGVR
jgi:xylose isomerase